MVSRGIYVFLDMHQDLFSAKFIDGAPVWATLDEGLYHPENCSIWYDAYLKSPAIIKAADNFWANKEAADGIGLLDHYEAMWEHIADKFNGYSNIIGFEPMNEPYMGSLAPKTFGMAVEKIKQTNPLFDMADIQATTAEEAEIFKNVMTEQFIKFDKETLMPFYNRILKAIRKISNKPLVTGGNIYCSTFVQTGIEHITDQNGKVDQQQIYAPHGYDSVVDTNNYDAYNKENVQRIFTQKHATQDKLELPVIVGEWGNFPSEDYTNDLIEHMSRILESYLWSSTYHQYHKGIESDENYRSLERGYPVSIAGDLLSYHYNYQKKCLTVTWEASNRNKTVLYMPDLTEISLKNIVASKKAKITIDKIDDAYGGYVTVAVIENGIIDVTVG